ncbi:MAG: XTP/dITP diphosphohydrolase [Pseudonocardiales bacterium]|nr:XTP/dITP diphosphohydrolase [Pseudonocardiales bacterium]MDQ1735320.1 XTP/dITP diphosphohydrolase [Pseudonocardiales bacterium]
MTSQVLLATRNTKKLAELRRILAEAIEGGTGEGLDVEVIGLDSVAAYDEVPETGATFAANALLKASEAVRHTGLLAVADDSGISVDALNGMPGVLSARWAGTAKDDDKNLELVLEQLADVPEDRLGAAFVCAAAFVTPTGERHVSEGVMPGRLIRQRRGTNGFGYDPIFVPEGFELTSAELEPVDKDAISHRGKALRSLLPQLLNALGAR